MGTILVYSLNRLVPPPRRAAAALWALMASVLQIFLVFSWLRSGFPLETLLTGAFALSFFAAVAWGLCFALVFGFARPLRINGVLALGGLAGSLVPLSLEAFGFEPTSAVFCLTAFALAFIAAALSRERVCKLAYLAAALALPLINLGQLDGGGHKYDVIQIAGGEDTPNSSLTREKLRQYIRHLRPNGMLVVRTESRANEQRKNWKTPWRRRPWTSLRRASYSNSTPPPRRTGRWFSKTAASRAWIWDCSAVPGKRPSYKGCREARKKDPFPAG
ncbi:MAG: hypothetical protein HC902_11295 [Calothrix sp. SM1_5_4]|nr:hypothetical protein [Calothrix sp. SM1_5_4]